MKSVKCVWKSNLDSKVEYRVDLDKKMIEFRGALGQVGQRFSGSDLSFKEDGLVIKSKSSYGYFLGRIKTLVEGVSEGYFLELEIKGRGYRFIPLTNMLLIKLGFMHYLGVLEKKGYKIIGTRNKIIIFGLDLEEINKIAGIIRNCRKPDVYKGKGIQFLGEIVVLKVGKKS